MPFDDQPRLDDEGRVHPDVPRLKFPLLDEMPEVFDGILLDFWWDLEKVIALNLPTRPIAVAELAWQLDLPWWRHNDRPFQLAPAQVGAHPDRYADEYRRTMHADLSRPIIVREADGRIVIVDGVHRVLKANLTDVAVLDARMLGDKDIPSILHVRP